MLMVSEPQMILVRNIFSQVFQSSSVFREWVNRGSRLECCRCEQLHKGNFSCSCCRQNTDMRSCVPLILALILLHWLSLRLLKGMRMIRIRKLCQLLPPFPQHSSPPSSRARKLKMFVENLSSTAYLVLAWRYKLTRAQMQP